jgi:hypothetical protein
MYFVEISYGVFLDFRFFVSATGLANLFQRVTGVHLRTTERTGGDPESYSRRWTPPG